MKRRHDLGDGVPIESGGGGGGGSLGGALPPSGILLLGRGTEIVSAISRRGRLEAADRAFQDRSRM